MKRTGGIRIGWYHASWPLATLYTSSNEIKIKVFLSDEYIFSPEQVVKIEKAGCIPIISQGIRIYHTIQDYPDNIIFYCAGNPEKIIKEIFDQGFRPQASSASTPRREGFPVRWQAIIAIIVLWNIPFLLEGNIFSRPNTLRISLVNLLGIIAIFFGSIALPRSKYLQSIIIKPGRSIGEIKHVVSLITVITGLLSFVFGLFYLFEA
jgi:hypothetical protein